MCKAQELKKEIKGKDWSKAVVDHDEYCVFLKYNGKKTDISVPLNNLTKDITSPKVLLAYAIQIAVY